MSSGQLICFIFFKDDAIMYGMDIVPFLLIIGIMKKGERLVKLIHMLPSVWFSD